MPRSKRKKYSQSTWPTVEQIAEVIFRTMRIERPEMTRAAARKAATKVRPSK